MENKSLIELLEEYSIVVPRIQRDYAQGRDGEHPQLVREKLLNDIRTAINGKPLDLSFVYGRVSIIKEENGTDKKIFFPADGQQRLTTLFLLHLVAFYDVSDMDELLKRFTYDARPTTRDFFIRLTEKREAIFSELKKMNDEEEKNETKDRTTPEELIRDSSWYFDIWNYDPSVKSALTVLNDIWKLWYKTDERNKLKTKLTDKMNRPLFFHFLSLEDLGREDDLYIKLNARGLPLTSFENFKSAFLSRTEEERKVLYDDISTNFDNEWSDFIWNIAKTGYDHAFLSFFEIIFQNHEILESETNKELSKEWHYNLDYSTIPGKVIESIDNTLNYLADKNKIGSMATKIVESILVKGSPSYSDRVMLHAVNVYLSDEPDVNNVNEDAFKDWLRIIANLANNTTIDKAELYKNAISGIDKITASKNTLLKDLADGTINTVVGFNKDQFDEECQKARIMEMDNKKRQNILEAEERLKYFGSQIRCALEISDYENKKDDDLFVEIINRLDLLFDDARPYDGKVLRRALLSAGNYLERSSGSSFQTFCVDDPKENKSVAGLKRLFSECGPEVQYVINNIKTPAENEDDVYTQLGNIISSKLKSIPQNEWRYCLISYPDLFDYMSPLYLRISFIKEYNTNEPLLVAQKNLNSNNCSVFLKALSYRLKSEGIGVGDRSVQKGTCYCRDLIVKDKWVRFFDSKYIVYDDYDNQHDYYKNQLWENSGSRTDIIDEVVEYLKSI